MDFVLKALYHLATDTIIPKYIDNIEDFLLSFYLQFVTICKEPFEGGR